jgi:transcriptional antiterminator
MTILTRQERERLVLELYYNQGKTYREISKEARISPRDIGVILNKVIKEKKTEGLREEEQDNIDLEKNQSQEQKQQQQPKHHHLEWRRRSSRVLELTAANEGLKGK